MILASSSVPDLGPAIQQIGIGALIAVPAYVTSWQLWKRLDKSLTATNELQAERVKDRDAQVLRERELADRLGPLLAQAADLLATAPDRFDKALSQAQNALRSNEVDLLMRRLEGTVERISQERGK